MAVAWPRRHAEQVLQGDLENPMTREVMEPSKGWGPATQLLGEVIQIADGGSSVGIILCLKL